MGRRGKGEGTISSKRANGSYMGRLKLPNGQFVYHYSKSRREVQDWLRRQLMTLEQGRPVISGRHTVEELLLSWLDSSVKPNRAYGTYKSYSSHIHQHILPALGEVDCKALTRQQVQQYLNGLRAKGLSTRTIQYHRAILHRALQQALKDEWVSRNVVALTEAPQVEKYDVEPLSIHQARRLLACLGDDVLYPIYLVALTTGLRQGEILGLRWEDIDLATGTAMVRQKIERKGGVLVETPFLKTDRTRRMVLLLKPVVDALRSSQGGQGRDTGLVFTTRSGRPYDGVYVTHHFQAALAKAGLPRMRFHDLRHGLGAILAALNVHPSVAQQILGHAQMSTTMNIYTRATPVAQREATAAVEEALFGSKVVI